MGIEGLLNFLKPITKKSHIEEFKGQKAAIDISSWLYKGCYSCSYELHQNIETHDYLYYIQKMVQLLKGYNITPIAVFDGKYLPAKEDTEKERQQQKQHYKEKAQQALEQGDEIEARKNFSRSLNITKEIVGMVMDTLIAQNIEVIVAPYEADPQIVHLVNIGYADFAISEDSDLICYGCQNIVYKLSVNGRCDIIRLQDWDTVQKRKQIENQNVRCFLSFNRLQTIECCLLSGCDYIDSIKNVGIVKSVKYIYKYQNISQVIKVLKSEKSTKQHIPQNYEFMVKRVSKIFLYHRVYDPIQKDFSTVNELPENFFEETLIGNKFDNLQEYVVGNLDIKTMQPRIKNTIDLNALLAKRIFNNNAAIQEAYKPGKKTKKEKIEAQKQFQELREKYYEDHAGPDEEELFAQEMQQESQQQNLQNNNYNTNQKQQQQTQKKNPNMFAAKGYDATDYFQMIEQEMMSTDEGEQESENEDENEEQENELNFNNQKNQLMDNDSSDENIDFTRNNKSKIYKNFQISAISERFSQDEFNKFVKNPLEIKNYLKNEQEFNSFLKFLQVYIFQNKIERQQIMDLQNLNKILDIYNQNIKQNSEFLKLNDINYFKIMEENQNFKNLLKNLNQQEKTNMQMFKNQQEILNKKQIQQLQYFQIQKQEYFDRKKTEISNQDLYQGLTTQQIIEKAVFLKKQQGEDFKEYELEKDEIEIQNMVEEQNSEDDNSIEKLQRNFYKKYLQHNLKNKENQYLNQNYNLQKDQNLNQNQEKWMKIQQINYEKYQKEEREFANQKYKPLTKIESLFKDKRQQLQLQNINNINNQNQNLIQQSIQNKNKEEEENWSDYSEKTRTKRQQRKQLRIIKFGSVSMYRNNYKTRFSKRQLNEKQKQQTEQRKQSRQQKREQRKQKKLQKQQQNQNQNTQKTKFNPFKIQNAQLNKINQSLDDIQISNQKKSNQQNNNNQNFKKSPVPLIQNKQAQQKSQIQVKQTQQKQNKGGQMGLSGFLVPKDQINKKDNNINNNNNNKNNNNTIQQLFQNQIQKNQKMEQEYQQKVDDILKQKKMKFVIDDDDDIDEQNINNNNYHSNNRYNFLKNNPNSIQFQDLDSTINSDQIYSVSFSSILTESE